MSDTKYAVDLQFKNEINEEGYLQGDIWLEGIHITNLYLSEAQCVGLISHLQEVFKLND